MIKWDLLLRSPKMGVVTMEELEDKKGTRT
jgi:hypothetical protein